MRTFNHGSVGVVGLGLLGRGIAATLVGHGIPTVAYSRSPGTRQEAASHIQHCLEQMIAHGWLTQTQAKVNLAELQIVDDYKPMADCSVVIESVIEDAAVKAQVFDTLENLVQADAVIASNTSAIAISQLQQGRQQPGRFVGMHWGEPCHISRFLEIIRGKQTSDAAFARAMELAASCGKEPSLIRSDVPGFVTNRLMYAMMREALHLLESGVADVETIDRSFRNDIGFWATIAGPFRWMDLTGISAYARVMKDLFPELATTHELPKTMRQMVEQGAEGVSNRKGFYEYDEASAKQWMQRWTDFTWQIRALADEHLPLQAAEATRENPDATA